MSLPDTSLTIASCKDFLHAEWAAYKQSGVVNRSPICIYSIGGDSDIPVACTESVGNSFKKLEEILHETFDLSVDEKVPLVSMNLMAGADGCITLWPKQKPKVPTTEETPEPETAQPGKKEKVPPTPEATFMNLSEQLSTYMLDHLKRLTEACLLAGNMKGLCYLLASALLIKSRITVYKQVLKLSTQSFPTVLNRCAELAAVLTQHVLNYHSDVIRSVILHDMASSDWSNFKEYEENGGVSVSIQMWSFYMQGIFSDLWQSCSPSVAVEMFNNILVDKLALLVRRYLECEQSITRQNQMRNDIRAILLVVASFLFALAKSPKVFFVGNIQNSAVLPIHRRMDLLVRIAALKCAPIGILSKAVCDRSPTSFDSLETPNQNRAKINSCPTWLTFFNPALFPAHTKQLSTLPDNVAVFITLKNVALKPTPDHGLIIRALFMRDFLASKVILNGIQNVSTKLPRNKPCENPLCYGSRCGPQLGPHAIYAAIIQLITDTHDDHRTLDSVMRPELKSDGDTEESLRPHREHVAGSKSYVNDQVSNSYKIDIDYQPFSFDLLDYTQVWNREKYPWYYALVQLSVPYVAPIVQQLLMKIPLEPPSQSAHPKQFSVRMETALTGWIKFIITSIEDILDMIPLGLLGVTQCLTDIVPKNIRPVGGHILPQVLISASYSIINNKQSINELYKAGEINKSQWDMILAVGERLCSLQDQVYEEGIERMVEVIGIKYKEALEFSVENEEPDSKISKLDQRENIDEYLIEESVEEVCNQIAYESQMSLQGQHAFGIVWQFLRRNIQWISTRLGDLENPPHFSETPEIKDNLGVSTSKTQVNGASNPPSSHHAVSFKLPDTAVQIHNSMSKSNKPPNKPKKTDELLSWSETPNIFNPMLYHNRIFYAEFENSARKTSDWEFLLNGEFWLPWETVKKLICQRPELKADSGESETDLEELKSWLNSN